MRSQERLSTALRTGPFAVTNCYSHFYRLQRHPPPPPHTQSPHNCVNSFVKKKIRAWETTTSEMHFCPTDSNKHIYSYHQNSPHTSQTAKNSNLHICYGNLYRNSAESLNSLHRGVIFPKARTTARFKQNPSPSTRQQQHPKHSLFVWSTWLPPAKLTSPLSQQVHGWNIKLAHQNLRTSLLTHRACPLSNKHLY